MSLYKRNNIWYMDVRIDGIRHRIPTGSENKKEAQIIHAQVVTDIQQEKWFEKQRAKTTTVKQMIERYIQEYPRQRDPQTIKKLLPAFGHLTLAQVDTDIIAEYRASRLQTVKPATVYQELSLLRHMFNVARKEWKWTRDNPVADLSFSVGNSNARDRWLTLEEEQNLLEQATNPSWLRPFLVTALHTGMRKGEILNLEWKDIDFDRRMLMIHRSKNGEKRSIPMSKTLYEVLKGIKVRDISGRVFPISDRSFRAAFDKTLKKIGISDFRPHDMRHTFATRLVQNNVDLYKVKELLGHKTIAMTTRYAHHCPESLRSSIDVLDTVSDFGHKMVTNGTQSV